MAKIKYVPEPGAAETHNQFGIEWGSDALEVTDPKVIAKCKASSFYEVDGVRYAPPDAPTEDAPKAKGRK